MDLALLLDGPGQRKDLPTIHDGRVILIQSVEQAQRRKRQISDVFDWTKAFAVYMAALASSSATSMEVVGLIAHLHLITQLSRDMSGSRWLKYDHDFREWAAAKGVRRWGEMNLTIYGRCLSYEPPLKLAPSSSGFSMNIPTKTGEKKGSSSRSGTKSLKKGSCFKYNFEEACGRSDCHFSHTLSLW